MTDFTNCRIIPGRAYNGANGSKIAVEYNGEAYMLKFPSSAEGKPTDLSYTNSCISEHIASSIFDMLGIRAQETMLGTFTVKGKKKLVCACKDFTAGGKRLFDFCSIKNTVLDSDSNGSGTELADVMDTIDKQQYVWLNMYGKYNPFADTLRIECEISRDNGNETFDYEPTAAETQLMKDMITEKNYENTRSDAAGVL